MDSQQAPAQEGHPRPVYSDTNYSTDPEAVYYSVLEVTRNNQNKNYGPYNQDEQESRQPSPYTQHTTSPPPQLQPKYEPPAEPSVPPPAAESTVMEEERKIMGLRRTTFVLTLLLIAVIIIAAVGGGVGGSIAVENARK